MKISDQIIDLLKTESEITANEICDKLQSNLQSVKVTLHRLNKLGRITREKKARSVKTAAGPQSLYIYKLNANA